METTRQTILSILRRRAATVDDITNQLHLAPATVRRHLDILTRDGHVVVEQERRRTGRPHFVYSISEKGEELFPKHYVRITNRLIDEIVALSPDETSGRDGRDLAQLVFEKMAHRLAHKIAPQIHGAKLAARLTAATEALAAEGIVFDVEPYQDGFLLIGHGCPCPRVAPQPGHACAHDQRLLTLLLSADVSYVAPAEVGREGFCAYYVVEKADQRNGASTAALPE
jgi:predicted ArsR family transcriptional regulator